MWFMRHKTLVMAVGIGFGALVLAFVAVIPIYQSVAKISGKIKTRSSELDKLTTKVSVLSQLDTNVLDERVKVLDSALPPRKDILLYLNSISGLSSELGMTFGGLSLSPGDLTVATESASTKKTKKKTGLGTLETQIKLSGNQESMYAFLRTIENVLPLMQINDIKISIQGENQYSLSLSLGMLWAAPVTADVTGPVTLFGSEENKYFEQLSQYRRFETVAIPQNNELEQKQDIFAPVEVIPQL